MDICGIDTWACNPAGTYLAATHPILVRQQEQWKAQQEAAHIPPALRMSYDHVWKNRYGAPTRSMMKQRATLGKLRKMQAPGANVIAESSGCYAERKDCLSPFRWAGM